ncbi:hypothetical protein F5X99DRAFT_400747 [Biscogniauxia marginata]|nr:hypothetical protein F5X99DRAFT_400747 [Biscogniauxia marginata]
MDADATKLIKPATAAHLRSLYAVLPKRGFEYAKGTRIIRHENDAVVFINTLAHATSYFGPAQVDRRLSELFKKAQEFTTSTENNPTNHLSILSYHPAFEYASRSTLWAADLGANVVIEVMNYLCGARALYIKFTTYRTPHTRECHMSEGRLAKAIDAFTGEKPVKKPLGCFRRMEPRLVDMMVERLRRGMRADWDKCSDYNDDSDEDAGKGNVLGDNMPKPLGQGGENCKEKGD